MKRNALDSFLRTVSSGRCACGMVVTSTDAFVSELAADCGCDFVWLDMEHSPLGIGDVARHISVLRGLPCAPFVRVGAALSHLLKPVLDLAPAAVIVPMVNSAADARRAVSLCRYPVHGGSRGAALRSNNCFGNVPLDEYLNFSEHEPLVLLQIEHRDAVENIDAILAVPGVGGICIGPFDLSFSYGKPGKLDDPEISAAIDLVLEKARRAGVMCGGFAAGDFWAHRAMQWKAVGEDAMLLASALRGRIAETRRNGACRG